MGSSETGRTRVAATDGRVSIEIRQRITSRMNFDRGVFTQAWWGTQRRRVSSARPLRALVKKRRRGDPLTISSCPTRVDNRGRRGGGGGIPYQQRVLTAHGHWSMGRGIAPASSDRWGQRILIGKSIRRCQMNEERQIGGGIGVRK